MPEPIINSSASAHAPPLQVALSEVRQYIRGGNLDGACRHLESLLQSQPLSVTVHALLGLLYGKAGRHKNAAAAFTAATILEPEKANHFINLGLACERLGSLGAAIQAYSQALQLKTDHPMAQERLQKVISERDVRLAGLLLKFERSRTGRDYGTLVATAHAIERLDGTHPAAQLVLADVDERAGRAFDAFGRLYRMAEMYPQTACFSERVNRIRQAQGPNAERRYWQQVAARRLRRGQLQATLEAAENARHCAPEDGETCLWHAQLLEQCGQIRAAQSAYRAASNHDETKGEACDALTRLKRKELARRRAQAGAHLSSALALRNGGFHTAALASLAQAEPSLRDDPLLFLLKSTIHQRNGNLQQSVMSAEIAVKLDPSSESAAELLDQLRRQRDDELGALVTTYLESGIEYLRNQELTRAKSAFELARERWAERRDQTKHPLRPLTEASVEKSLEEQEIEMYRGCICTSLALGNVQEAVALAEAMGSSRPAHASTLEMQQLVTAIQEQGFDEAVVWGRVLTLLPTETTPLLATPTATPVSSWN